MSDFLEHWEFASSKKHDVSIFDPRAQTLWKALSCLRDPNRFHGDVSRAAVVVDAFFVYVRNASVAFLKTFSVSEAWLFKMLTALAKYDKVVWPNTKYAAATLVGASAQTVFVAEYTAGRGS